MHEQLNGNTINRSNRSLPNSGGLPSMSADGPEEGKLARLRFLAEQEMRRRLPTASSADDNGAPGAKRRKGDGNSTSVGGRPV
jgi:hypothetical protein